MFAFEGRLVWTAYMVGAAAVMDFLDGFAARMLSVHTEIGKQLDSLADMVSFGLVPGVVMFQLLNNFNVHSEAAADHSFTYSSLIAFLIPVFSAIRLAKFNTDTRQTDSFIGLPTPANSIFICSFPLILYCQPRMLACISEEGWYYALLILSIIMSLLLVAPFRLFALKFKNFSWADNKIRYLFLIVSAVMLVLFQYTGIPFIIILYLLMSALNNVIKQEASSPHQQG